MTRARAASVVALALALLALDGHRDTALVDRIAAVHGLTPAQKARVQAIFDASTVLGQGNPAVSRHPLTPAQCEARERAAGMKVDAPTFREICGGPYMAPLYDPASQRPEAATACIDQFEFPDIPCALPVVWVRASEAADLCEAMGKRLCDAHEWEGACAGKLEPPDYRFDLAAEVPPGVAVERMRKVHNAAARPKRGDGSDDRPGRCATGSSKTPGCDGSSFEKCGSNSYPDGSFPACHSALGVYDLHGNVAEHMNLPLAPDEMASRGSTKLGVTEMKGSWFVFDKIHAHEDWCRWRAPFWHGTRVRDPDSHRNYHLGFRCCRTISVH